MSARKLVERIETEAHRHVYAAERLSEELDEMPEDLAAAVEAWLADHPEVVVGAEVGAEVEGEVQS